MGTSWHPGPRLIEPNGRDRLHSRNPGDDFRPDSRGDGVPASLRWRGCRGEELHVHHRVTGTATASCAASMNDRPTGKRVAAPWCTTGTLAAAADDSLSTDGSLSTPRMCEEVWQPAPQAAALC
jgi:hypothetical protein